MSFAPPPGPPPPSVPEGWTTQFDDTYRRWFFINLSTGKSQWDSPQSTLIPQPPPAPSEQSHPSPAAPPSYEESGPATPSALASAEDSEKKKSNLFHSNNPYSADSGPAGASGVGSESGNGNKSASAVESDAELAARLQAEEDTRGFGGAAANYYNSISNEHPHSPIPSETGERGDKGKKKGFFSKLMGKASSASANRPMYAPPRPQHHPPYGYPPQGPYGAHSPSPGPGYGAPGGYYPPQQGYGPPGPGYGPGYGYPQQGYYPGGGGTMMQPPRRSGGGGMGMAGAAALGIGGGLIGGALLADAIDDDHGDYGGDYGGDDFGGDF